MHIINGDTHVKVPQKRYGYIHYKCGRWHVVKFTQGKRYSLGAYDTLEEAELILQKANKMVSENRLEEWYRDYKIMLRKRHDLHLTEAKRKTNKS